MGNRVYATGNKHVHDIYRSPNNSKTSTPKADEQSLGYDMASSSQIFQTKSRSCRLISNITNISNISWRHRWCFYAFFECSVGSQWCRWFAWWWAWAGTLCAMNSQRWRRCQSIFYHRCPIFSSSCCASSIKIRYISDTSINSTAAITITIVTISSNNMMHNTITITIIHLLQYCSPPSTTSHR